MPMHETFAPVVTFHGPLTLTMPLRSMKNGLRSDRVPVTNTLMDVAPSSTEMLPAAVVAGTTRRPCKMSPTAPLPPMTCAVCEAATVSYSASETN